MDHGGIWVDLKDVAHLFFKITVCHLLENHSQLLRGHDFANERLLVCQFDV